MITKIRKNKALQPKIVLNILAMKKELNKKNPEKVLSNGNSEKQEFEKYLQKIEDPEYDGQDVSWHLPENATPVEKAKYELCEKMLIYQQDNNLSDEEIAN